MKQITLTDDEVLLLKSILSHSKFEHDVIISDFNKVDLTSLDEEQIEMYNFIKQNSDFSKKILKELDDETP